MEDIKFTPANYKSDQAVRWCPGCGDHAILNTLHKAMASIGVPPHKMAVISGIGCSSRLPYYMNTYGFHTIHGRAAAIATGFKVANPEMTVWQISGDGDGLACRAPQRRYQHTALQQQDLRSYQGTVFTDERPWLRIEIISLRHYRGSVYPGRARVRRTRQFLCPLHRR